MRAFRPHLVGLAPGSKLCVAGEHQQTLACTLRFAVAGRTCRDVAVPLALLKELEAWAVRMSQETGVHVVPVDILQGGEAVEEGIRDIVQAQAQAQTQVKRMELQLLVLDRLFRAAHLAV